MPTFESVLDYVERVIEEEEIERLNADRGSVDEFVEDLQECDPVNSEGGASQASGGVAGWLVDDEAAI